MVKLVCIPTQRYYVLSGKVGMRFVGTLSVELDDVQSWKWNSERVILQHSQGVINSKHICAHILFLLYCWNSGEFVKLVKDIFNVATRYLGKARGIQIKEQRHGTFSNLVQKENCARQVDFSMHRRRGGFQPNESEEYLTGIINKIAILVLEGNHPPPKKIPPVLR